MSSYLIQRFKSREAYCNHEDPLEELGADCLAEARREMYKMKGFAVTTIKRDGEVVAESDVITLNTGDLAYLDTLSSGLIKLKVIRIENDTRQDGKPVKHVVARVTADRHAYKRGEIINTEMPGRIIPRAALKRSRGSDWPVILPFTIGE